MMFVRKIIFTLFVLPLPIFAQNIQFPEPQIWQTSEGLTVWYLPEQSLPMVDFKLMFRAGSLFEKEQYGLANITNQMVGVESLSYNEQQINERLDSLGANLSSESRRDSASINMRCLSDDIFTQCSQMIFELLKKPKFSQQLLSRIVDNQIVDLKSKQNQPDFVVFKKFMETLYTDHPYANVSKGTEQSLIKISTENVKIFYENHYTPKNAILTIVGDVSKDLAVQFAYQLSQSLPQKNNIKRSFQQTESIGQEQKIHMELEANQNHILLGQLGPDINDPGYVAFYVANQTLGGSALTSILGNEIREKNGWAYSVGSYFQPMLAGGPWIIYLQTANQTANLALGKVNEILNNSDEYLNDKKIQQTIEYLQGSFPLKLDGNYKLLNQLSTMAFYNYSPNYLNQLYQSLGKINYNEVRKVWNSYLDKGSLLTVSVGLSTDR